MLKIEHPRGDPARTHGPAKDGVALWWAQLARNKRCLSLYLGAPEGADIFKRLVVGTDDRRSSRGRVATRPGCRRSGERHVDRMLMGAGLIEANRTGGTIKRVHYGVGSGRRGDKRADG